VVGCDRAALCRLRWQYAGVLISPNIGGASQIFGSTGQKFVTCRSEVCCVTIGPSRQFLRVEVEIFRSASPIFLAQSHMSITRSFLDSYKMNHWLCTISGFDTTSHLEPK